MRFCLEWSLTVFKLPLKTKNGVQRDVISSNLVHKRCFGRAHEKDIDESLSTVISKTVCVLWYDYIVWRSCCHKKISQTMITENANIRRERNCEKHIFYDEISITHGTQTSCLSILNTAQLTHRAATIITFSQHKIVKM